MPFAHKNWNWYGPTHFIPPPGSGLDHACDMGVVTGDKVDLEQLWGPAAVIDVTALAGAGAGGESPEVLRGHILEREDMHGVLESGDVVLFHGG